MKKYRNKIGFILVGILCLLYGCGAPEITDSGEGQKAYVSSEKQQEIITLDDIDLYRGNTYIELNGNQPDFTEEDYTLEPFETYSPLDGLGRCGVAYANICQALMPKEDRGKIGMVKPSGWHTVKYDFVDGKYLYNRCHLIGYQLAGENANEKNLITGTRYMNVEGMLPFENQVADYVRKTDHHVLYKVTPVFSEDNLLADGVEMQAYSVEDEGQGVSFHVFVYNTQPGVEIDYATGESRLKDEETAKPIKEAAEQTTEKIIGNKNSKVYHRESCSRLPRERNRVYFNSEAEAKAAGYDNPCDFCNP